MASAKSHTGTTLDSTKTTYWDDAAEGGVGPLFWDIIPSVDADIFLSGGYIGNTEAIRVQAGKEYTVVDPARELTKIEANKASGASDGTIIIRPGATS